MKRALLAATAALALAACGDSETPAVNDYGVDDMSMNAMDMNAAGNDMAMNASAAVPATGQDYASMAGASDLFEIQSSQLALERTQNADIRQFAQMLVTDHQAATANLRTAAQQAQPAVTVDPQLNAEQQANMGALRAASGADFDRLYLQQQVPAHEKALAMLRGYAESGDVPALREHASTTAGPVERHLERARELMGAMGS